MIDWAVIGQLGVGALGMYFMYTLLYKGISGLQDDHKKQMEVLIELAGRRK